MRLFLALLVLTTIARAEVNYGEPIRLKIPITGETRKGFLFLPKGLKKGATVPLLVAIPDKEGKSSLELGQWQQQAYDHRFAVFSVDVTTPSVKRPWHWKEKLRIQRDMEAVIAGIDACISEAKQAEVTLDRSAIVMTGHSGGSYVVLWLGLRRPDLFLGICGRSCVFFKETLDFGKFEKVEPNHDMPIFLFHGELDAPRPRKDTRVAKETLDKAGYKNVEHRVIEGMKHEPKPDVFLEWFYALLKRTAKGRKEAGKIAVELEKLKPDIESNKPGVFGKVQRLADREKKAGFSAGAVTALATIEAKADRGMKEAAALLENGSVFEAIEQYKKVEKEFKGLDIAKKARKYATNLRKSNAFKAHEMLLKAQKLIDKDRHEKAVPILEKIVAQFPDTKAAGQAKLLLKN